MTCPLPIVDLDVYLGDPESSHGRAQAEQAAIALIEYGALIVKDTRVSEDANQAFLDLLEDYFAQPQAALEEDLRPEVHYQVGITLENTEKPKCHSFDPCKAVIAALDPCQRPLDLEGGKADPKCRFFHRMGRIPPQTDFPSLRMENVSPRAFADRWESGMAEWGTQIKTAVEGVSQMVAQGLGLPMETFTDAGEYGSHLLAPTSTDLIKYGKVGEIFAGFHTDLNFLTIHGRSRFPGLHVWARNSGKRITVKLPPGHLLVQAGKQLEHFTGGLILAGYHEVVCTDATVAALSARLADPATSSRPQYRISSTFFYHLSSDYTLSPTTFHEATEQNGIVKREVARLETHGERWDVSKYEEGMKVGTLVQEELKHIALFAKDSS
ncbi:hypothetical protein JCM11641_008023 [Rhodosporidiobolus odoratus]